MILGSGYEKASWRGKNLWKICLVMGKTGDIKNAVKNAESAIKVYRKCKLPNTKIVAGQLATWKGSEAKV